MKNTLLGTLLLILTSFAFGHPTGNMITVGEHVLWPYINPINDPDHHACVMIWTEGTEPRVYFQSSHTASDFMLFNNHQEIYLIERKFIQSSLEFQIRVLKSNIGEEPRVIWDWFTDEYRIGEGGFFMLSDHQMVFGKYPNIYTMSKGDKPITYFDFDLPIKRIRAVENNQILLLSDDVCTLVQQDGTVLKQWNQIIDQSVKHAPMDRNQVFDADYSQGALLLAYWGRRSFDLIKENGERKILLQQTDPLTPHWVAFWKRGHLLFSSKLVFDGSTPKPHLSRLDIQNILRVIWDSP